MAKEFEVDEYVVHPLIRGLRCVDCGDWLDEKPWFTCSSCGKTICEECRVGHIPLCMALTWAMAKVDPETGELVQEEKPQSFKLG